jgi:hypothetical protein
MIEPILVAASGRGHGCSSCALHLAVCSTSSWTSGRTALAASNAPNRSTYRCPNGRHGPAQPEPVWARPVWARPVWARSVWARPVNRAGPCRPTGCLSCPSTALHRPIRAGPARKARPTNEPGPARARQVNTDLNSHSSHLNKYINSQFTFASTDPHNDIKS